MAQRRSVGRRRRSRGARRRERSNLLDLHPTGRGAERLPGRARALGNLAIVSDVYRHAIRAIDLGTRTELWQSAQSGTGYINSEGTPLVVGDTIFVASTDETLYALDVHTGAVLWRTAPAGGSLGSVAVCGHLLVVTLAAGGDPQVVDRRTHAISRARILPSGEYVFSAPAAGGATAFATGQQGVHAFSCG